MALPSGYTQLEYIQSGGTQFIDTGFRPNQDTRIVMDATLLDLSSDNDGAFLFGSGYPVQQNGFEAYVFNNVFCGVYNGTQKSGTQTFSVGQRVQVDFSKNVCTVQTDGATVYNSTFTYAAFQSPVNLALFVLPRSSKYYGILKCYSCQIYDNGTLARDFVPVKRKSDGAVGLYDAVHDVFYGNAGTGAFTAGPEAVGSHTALIGGTVCEISRGKALAGGTAYDIAGGKTMVDGTVYDITFESSTYTVEIMNQNNVNDKITYIMVNGTKMNSPQTIEVDAGTVIQVYARNGQIYLNGVVAPSVAGLYEYTVFCNVQLTYYDYYNVQIVEV